MEEAAPVETAPHREPPSRTRLLLVAVPIVGLIIASNVGDILTSSWAEQHPLWLIMLNSRNRVLLLTSNQLGPVSFYVVATLRLLISDPLFFLLGIWYGDSAIRWIERRSPSIGKMMRQLESSFGFAAYPLVALMPNQWICLLAGAAGMSVGGFFVVNVVGTVVRLYLLRVLGDTFDKPIDSVLGFFAEYRWPLFFGSLALFGGFLVVELRRAKKDFGALETSDDD
jgi:membrane protein DedA with SNARE-associated domain